MAMSRMQWEIVIYCGLLSAALNFLALKIQFLVIWWS